MGFQWEFPELNGGFRGTEIEHIFQPAMFDDKKLNIRGCKQRRLALKSPELV
jgi:hypothetical protein